MAYTALTLITRSFYSSKIVGRQLQNVTASQIGEGLALLNELLDIKGSDLRLIPYYRRDTFDTIAQTEQYYVAGLYEPEVLSYNYTQLRYPMQYVDRDSYFGIARVNTVYTLPTTYTYERELGGTRFYLYPIPDTVYEMQYSGKFALTNVTLQTDLLLYYDRFYIAYLRYALTDSLCTEWGMTTPADVTRRLEEIKNKLLDISTPDLTIQGVNYFSRGQGVNYGIANICNGWLPIEGDFN